MIADRIAAWRPQRQWWVTFAFVVLLGSLWAIATPPFAGPDEGAHAVRAASVVRGDLAGETFPGSPDFVRYVPVSLDLADGFRVSCFAMQPNSTPDCVDVTAVPEFPTGRSGDTLIPTTAGRHPPAYYAVVGLPSLVWPGSDYAMRAAGILVAAALLASAFVSAGHTSTPRLAIGGLMFALTPMVLFVEGIVNPSTFEIAGAIGLWTSGAVLATEFDDGGRLDSRLITRMGVAATALVLSRSLSPLWLALIGVSLMVFASRALIRALFAERLFRVWAAVVVIAAAAQTAWVIGSRALDEIGEGADLPVVQIIRLSLGKQWAMLQHMVGNFGWLDTPAPSLTLAIWLAAVGFLGLLCASVCHQRQWLAMLAVAVASVVVPVALESSQVSTSGFVWQGRYTLPLAVGIPILAGVSLAATDVAAQVGRRLGLALGALWTVGHMTAFMQHLRRNTVGGGGRLRYWVDPAWSPPIWPWALTILYAVLLGVVAWYLVGRLAATGPQRTGGAAAALGGSTT